jgi:hypothetical protein
LFCPEQLSQKSSLKGNLVALNTPTILVVHEDPEFRSVLRQIGYLVLEAHDANEALAIVVQQSRPIHLLLGDDSDDGRTIAATLKPYRRDMNVIHVNPNLELDAVLKEVLKVLPPPAHKPKYQKSSRTAAK